MNLESSKALSANLDHASLNSANLASVDLTQANLLNASLEDVEMNQANLTGANVKGAKIKRRERKPRCGNCGELLDKSGQCPVCTATAGSEVLLKRSLDLNPLIFFMALFAGPLLWMLDSTFFIANSSLFGPIFTISLALGIILSVAAVALGFVGDRKELASVKGAKIISIFNIVAWVIVSVTLLKF